ncbi:DUF2845 domain-containing protein [Pseudomonas massiliensis]|uniref:DUF2845 domain-containing protein n=1 Tax=Pseudomonas massiliensis TaxID=522492 RepID=UPI00058E5AE0|nr:DUF2845 domain-containing protein [Pseudomonas massiliensis]
MKTQAFALLVVLLLPCVGQADQTFRCDSALVSVNDSTAMVLRKCGEPASRAAISYVRVIDAAGRMTSLPAEQWTYGPRGGMYHYLRFEGDRLVDVRGERG